MVYITTKHVHPQDLSYLGDLLMSSKFHTHVPIHMYSYFTAKDNIGQIEKNVFNIQFSAEREVIDTRNFHLTFGSTATDIDSKKIWYPYLLKKNPYDLLLKNKILNEPTKFCSFVVLNHRCEMRNKFFDYVCEKYKKVDSLGKHKRNVEDSVAAEVEKYSYYDHRYLEVLS